MSRSYDLTVPAEIVINMLKAGKIPGLKHYQAEEAPARELWPDGVTDGQNNFAWFEKDAYRRGEDCILVWSTNNESEILRILYDKNLLVG